MEYQITTATKEDFDQITKTIQEIDHWDLNFCEYNLWQAAFGSKSCTVAKTKEGEVFGLIVCGGFDSDFGVAGNFYLKRSFRGRGIGLELSNKAWDNCLKDYANVAIFGVEDMWMKYYNFGFKHVADYSIVSVTLRSDADYGKINEIIQKMNESTYPAIKILDGKDDCLSDDLLAKLTVFDTRVNGGVCRKTWLRHYVMQYPNGVLKVAVNGQKELLGFGHLRTNGMGHKIIGPLYANSEVTALKLIQALIQSTKPGDTLKSYYFSCNEFMDQLLTDTLGVDESKTWKLRVLFRWELVKVDHGKIFCPTGLDVAHV